MVQRSMSSARGATVWTVAWLCLIGCCASVSCSRDSGSPWAGDGGGSGPLSDAGPSARPEAPPWRPHFGLAEPGWRESREPLCTEHFGLVGGRDVWTDGDSVFALVATSCNPLAGAPCGGEGLSLYENGGDGWRVLYETRTHTDNVGVSGFVAGDVLIYGHHEDCSGITHVRRNGEVRCAFMDESFLGVTAVATADEAGYALASDRLLAYESPEWREIATLASTSGSALWSGDETVVVAGYRQLAMRSEGGGDLAELPGVPTGDYTAAWSFGAEIWLANTAGQLVHFDGQDWSVTDTGTGEALQLWGTAEGVLYFVGDKSFGRWTGSAIELFAERPAQANAIRFTGIWGNGENEVFLSVVDQSLRDYQCSGAFMVFFDGSDFHVF